MSVRVYIFICYLAAALWDHRHLDLPARSQPFLTQPLSHSALNWLCLARMTRPERAMTPSFNDLRYHLKVLVVEIDSQTPTQAMASNR